MIDFALVSNVIAFWQSNPPPGPEWLTLTKDWTSIITDVLTALGLIIGACWAAYTYAKNSRIKAAEMLLKQEETYLKDILPLLLQLEYDKSYGERFLPALKKSNAAVAFGSPSPEGYSDEESNAIDDMEKVLRHFLTAAFIGKRNVDDGLMDEAYAYYLEMFNSAPRKELQCYIEDFWPTVYVWTQTYGKKGRERRRAANKADETLRAKQLLYRRNKEQTRAQTTKVPSGEQ